MCIATTHRTPLYHEVCANGADSAYLNTRRKNCNIYNHIYLMSDSKGDSPIQVYRSLMKARVMELEKLSMSRYRD